MTWFRSTVFSSLLAGLLTGVVISAIQFITVIPMIIEAEGYEISGNEDNTHTAPLEQHSTHDTRHHEGETQAHQHEHPEWKPGSRLERGFYTLMTNILAAVGFALILTSCFVFLARVNWKVGLVWGLGGFAAFQLAPSLGLPPELPGTAAAELEMRQIWWVSTAVLTACGLILSLRAAHIGVKILGLILIAVPHLMGAPQPSIEQALAPQSLISRFEYSTTLVGALFWMVLGVTTAKIFQRLSVNKEMNKESSRQTIQTS